MLKGYNLVGQTMSAAGDQYLKVFSTVRQQDLPEKFAIATTQEVESAVQKASQAFAIYKNATPAEKAVFLETIAEEILAIGEELIQRAMAESGLPEARLVGERGRTVGQLRLFASVLREGSWVEAVIDPALPERQPLPRADIRKMLVPLGPVLVFGASNFPFAFSTAGGDTAAALAAGNPVIVKAHESHLGTNELMAGAIRAAIHKCGLPDGLFSSLIGTGSFTGMQLVKHPGIKAIGFTGSYNAGMAIYKAAINERAVPIPVYAEMSSINPVLVLTDALTKAPSNLAQAIAGSISLGMGQFCTNPGLLFLIESDAALQFTSSLISLLAAVVPAPMLNAGICRSYYEHKKERILQPGITVLLDGIDASEDFKGSTALLQVNAADFITYPALQSEIFGPVSLIVLCKDKAELKQAIEALQGQLTGTVFASSDDLKIFDDCISGLSEKIGRLVYNGVPTGVEVCHAMVHGGPYPATTDARSTSVGADAIKRFARPICLQDCPADSLPDALKNENPLQLMRKVNGVFTSEPI